MKAYRLPLLFLIFLALPIWLLGAWGFWRGRPEDVNHFADALYRSLQLFALEGGDQAGHEVWQVQVARFAAPASTLTLIVSFLRSFVLACRQQWARTFWCGHDVICGLGAAGMALARDLRTKKRRVIAIEIDPHNPHVEEARRLGIVIIHGDAQDASVMAGAAIHNARSVVVAAGHDDANVSIVLRVVELMKPRRLRRQGPLIICPHLVHRETRNMLRDQIGTVERDVVELRDFSKYDLSARALFQEHPLDGTGVSAVSTTKVHLILIGFGTMGGAILEQALRLGHFANGRRLLITIFDHEASKKYECLCGCFPNLAAPTSELPPIADITPVDGEVVCVDREQRLAEIAGEPDTQVLAVIAADTDIECLRIAQHLPKAFASEHVRVCIRMRRTDGVSQLVSGQRTRFAPGEPRRPRLHAFGQLDAVCDEERVIASRQDRLARAIHKTYLAHQSPPPGELKRQHEPWDSLDEEFRESSRQAADFIPVLLRSCGYVVKRRSELKGRTPLQELPPADLEIMARLEHARWYAERYLAGWTYAPQREDALRRHNHMVEWDRLSDRAKQIDRDQVRCYLQILVTLEEGEFVVSAADLQ